jgi:peptide methionine sulfoxide reductase msrA/msrB
MTKEQAKLLKPMLIGISGIVMLAIGFAAGPGKAGKPGKDGKKMPTNLEKQVIENKGTEPPFSGKYVQHKADGTYICKRCGAELFSSEDKFDSQSGWPSFDDAIEGAVERIPDPDGMRTEIICAGCKAHLGHAFDGEGMTEKNLRHCVNSVSLDFVPATTLKQTDRAIFAGGCYWGVEYYFSRKSGVISVTSGFIGGHVENPTYDQVCSGETGHAEAVEVVFDASRTSYEELARLFFEIHDPTQINGQGPDVGSQYRSAVFYLDDGQRLIVEKLIANLVDKGLSIVTEVEQAGQFWAGPDYHQDYYDRNGKRPYCHSRVKRF